MIRKRSDFSDAHIEYFSSHIQKSDKCWAWTGGTNGRGYGFVDRQGVRTVAHRLSYILHVGEIEEGLVIDHICRNRMCVNPAHLRAVTRGINSVENSCGPSAKNKLKTHCIRGHEFNSENTAIRYHSRDKKFFRQCRACQQIYPSILKIRGIA